jgi:DNA polymerase
MGDYDWPLPYHSSLWWFLTMNEVRIALVGEAWGEQEEEEGKPFVGASGKFFNHCLAVAGISRRECLVTNVFNLRPRPTNDIKNLCGSKADGIPGFPALIRGKYIRREYEPELHRLYLELDTFKPTLIVALGATAAWALLHASGIRKIRGAPAVGYNGYKVLPTYHPTAILRQYSLYPILIADLQKAEKEARFPEVRRPNRTIYVPECLDDLYSFERQWIADSDSLSIDVETAGNQITYFGVAPTTSVALVIPILDERKADKSYWPDLKTEVAVWQWIASIASLPRAKVVGQNFNYDLKFLFQSYGIPVLHANHDTMLLHHAMQPELEKGLGFLGSIYTNELAWKFMRPKHTLKKED